MEKARPWLDRGEKPSHHNDPIFYWRFPLPGLEVEQVEDRSPISNATLTFSPMTRTMAAIEAVTS